MKAIIYTSNTGSTAEYARLLGKELKLPVFSLQQSKNKVPADADIMKVPVFTLQGNFDVKKLHGVYRFMMNVMVKTAGKGLAEK